MAVIVYLMPAIRIKKVPRGPVESAVRRAIYARDLEERYEGTAQLAIKYASSIDEDEDLNRLGPLLLQCLESLILTPRSIAQAMKGNSSVDPTPSNPLDELRERRERRERERQDGTEAVDSSTP